MNRRDLVLAVLSSSGGDEWSPVQVQKVFFLLDKRLPGPTGGPHWEFRAYDYGPFDANVYAEIDRLHSDGLAVINGGEFSPRRRFQLTPAGQQAGQAQLDSMDKQAREYTQRLSDWVRSVPFQTLVSAVYKEYPDMRANSVFKDPGE